MLTSIAQAQSIEDIHNTSILSTNTSRTKDVFFLYLSSVNALLQAKPAAEAKVHNLFLLYREGVEPKKNGSVKYMPLGHTNSGIFFSVL